MKRNVTIVLDEEVARWARIRAAEADRSLSRFVGEVLHRKMEEGNAYEAAMRRFLSWKPRPLKRKRARYPRREDLYDRPGLR